MSRAEKSLRRYLQEFGGPMDVSEAVGILSDIAAMLVDLDDFVSRWADWLADAAAGQVHRPSHMPEQNPSSSWRQ